MPKARNKGASDQVFSVSPWHSRSDQASPAEDLNAPEHTVVYEQLVVTPPSAPGGSSADHAPARSPPAAGEWRTRKRASGVTDVAGAQQQTSPVDALEALPEAEQVAVEAPLQRVQLEGQAVLAALPNASITGNFILGDGSSYGISGHEVLAYRECTRDADWAVVRLSLVDFRSGQEVTLLVERTEGDAMRLRAPVEWQGMEAEAAAELSVGCATDVTLRFDCDRLLADAAAEALLAVMQPKLCGRGSVVNIGHMLVDAPTGMPVFGRSGGGAGSGGGGGGAKGGSRTGRGSMQAGTAVVDSDDMWT